MISNKFSYIFIFLLGILFFAGVNLNAKGDKKNKKVISKTADQIANTYIDINNLSSLVSNVGFGDYNTNSNLEGTVYPKGSGKTCIFETGFVWGAFIAGDDVPHVGGSTYSTGLTPGPIMADGHGPADPNSENYRIFRVRPDIYPGGPTIDLSSDAANESTTESDLRAQYEKDWNEWPAAGTANDLGAPFTDNNGDGIYEPDTDIPGVPGADQTVYWIANDQNKDVMNSLYGTDPLGIEIHGTYWAYAQQGALGNMYFKKYTIINKGYQKYTLDSMFVSWWADIDNGNSADDYTGNDTTLSLTYCYNADAVDATYSPLPPPVVGADFFQGPIVSGEPSDSAIFNGRIVYGKRNLPMTAAYYFINSDPVLVDPTLGGDPIGSTQFYRLMNGEFPLTGQEFTDPVTGQFTKFVLTGDPVTRTGWIDGVLFPKGDRRQGMASGPFTMAPGDTQEVAVAQIVAGAIPGVDRLSAIGLLKFYDQTAQSAYNNFFNLPTPPRPPQVQVAALDKKIVLSWGDPSSVQATENQVVKGYKFEGYNVYQLPNRSASLSEAARVATFDVNDGILKITDDFFDPSSGVVLNHVVQFGSDNGVQRYITISGDAFNGSAPLINGIKYYFAVTAYSYNADGVPHALENPISIIGGANGIVPQNADPGVTYSDVPGDTLSGVVHSAGSSDGNVFPMVIDPTQLKGLSYTVTFDTVHIVSSFSGEDTLVNVWNVDRSDGVRVLTNQTDQDADNLSPIVDGIQFKVIGAPLDFKAFDMTSNGAGPVSETVGYDITKAPTDKSGYSCDWYRDVALGDASILNLPNGMQVNGGWFFAVAGSNNITSHSAAIGRWTRNGANWSKIIPNNYEIRFTQNGGKGWMAFSTGTLVDVPFEIWYLGPNLDDPSDDIRMMPWIFDENGDDKFDFYLDHQASGGNNDPYCDWIYFMMPEENAAPGEAAYNAAVARTDPNYDGSMEIEHIARFSLMNWNEHQANPTNPDSLETAMPDVGTVIRIRSNVPNLAKSDVFSFVAPKPSRSDSLAKVDVQHINVFPNPYYGVNTQEVNKYARFVTFNHLPDQAKIRIFNLAGILVKTIDHNGTQFERWDLNNQDGYPVGSGLYIAYIDMPSLGTTKILKIAIIQEQQVLDRY